MADVPRQRAEELTGELPRFVVDAVGEPTRTEPGELTEDDEAVVAALVELGVDEPGAREAVETGRVPLVLTATVLGESRDLSLDEFAERTGLDPGLVRRLRAASGLPLPQGFGPTDLAWAEGIAALLEVMPEDAILRAARARGSALSSIARSDLALIRDEMMLPMRQAGADDLAVSIGLAETASALEPTARELLQHTYRLQLLEQLDSQLSALLASAEGQEIEMAVGFVDLVGYTALSARVDPEGLDDVLDAFERRVVDVVGGNPHVHVVKYLGDAAMLVAPELGPLTDAMLELTCSVEELDDAPLRGGLAAGPTLVREGDYFGATVNMAARLTDMARPWSLLAAEELIEELSDGFDVRRTRPMRIRGVGLRRPLSVRRPD